MYIRGLKKINLTKLVNLGATRSWQTSAPIHSRYEDHHGG